MVQYMSPALGVTFMNCLRRQTLVGQHEVSFVATRSEFDRYQRNHIVRQRANPREHKLARPVDLQLDAGNFAA